MVFSLFTWQHGSLPGIQVGLNSMLAKLVNTHTHTPGASLIGSAVKSQQYSVTSPGEGTPHPSAYQWHTFPVSMLRPACMQHQHYRSTIGRPSTPTHQSTESYVIRHTHFFQIQWITRVWLALNSPLRFCLSRTTIHTQWSCKCKLQPSNP
jgi:hypothetical protein